VSIVVEYLAKSWVSSKYIEEVIPENNLEKILTLLRNPESPESKFIKRLFISLVLTNIITILLLAFLVFYFTRKIILPIKRATTQIANLKPWESKNVIRYDKKDEIGLLIKSINWLNTRLSIQEKIRSRLLADISHELKTPITSIQCYLEWISDWVIELSEKNLKSITWEMWRLTQLVNQIMEFERFENSKIVVDKQMLNPYNIISWITETQKTQLSENKQTISVEWSKNIEVFLDKDLFTQLVYNLIGNFRKYAWVSAHLSILISAKEIVFSDNWQWISTKEIPFLFEKFYQWKKEKTGSIEVRGIGVWLSIVKKIIHSHWWDATVTSDSGKWFNFTIKF
jgi:two-component system sensor histidine kinase BaeS